MQPAEQQNENLRGKPQPFSDLYRFSVESSAVSDCSNVGARVLATPGQLCSCGSLTGWSSLQLQEQHLLGSSRSACHDHSSSYCIASGTPQDMVVLVLPRADKDAAGAVTGPAHLLEKPRMSAGGASTQQSVSGSSVRQVCCNQSPRQLTQELCLRLVALLLVVLATVGLAYRLAKRDS